MAARSEDTRVRVVFFDDMRGSTALKERLTGRGGEEAFQELRKEHDRLVTAVVTRDDAGEVIKSTGDGLIALFERPSTAVERPVADWAARAMSLAAAGHICVTRAVYTDAASWVRDEGIAWKRTARTRSSATTLR
jgi:class 3 adenylate cyclase